MPEKIYGAVDEIIDGQTMLLDVLRQNAGNRFVYQRRERVRISVINYRNGVYAKQFKPTLPYLRSIKGLYVECELTLRDENGTLLAGVSLF